jgi:hypothetical protein
LNPFQKIYDAQKAYFGIGITRGYEWRVEQLDRMARLLSENEAALQKVVAADFKTASQEFVFETAAPLGETQFQKSQLKAWMEPCRAPGRRRRRMSMKVQQRLFAPLRPKMQATIRRRLFFQKMSG